jgi:hypothetical protein
MMKLSRTHSILAFVAALASLLPAAAHAQKPALTQNIDEKGRTPYYASQYGTCSNPSNPACYITFPAVPAGYRLVVTYVSINYVAASSGGLNSCVLYENIPGSGDAPYGNAPYQVWLPAPTANGQNNYTYSNPLTVYVEAGAQLSMFVGNVLISPDFPLVGTINGYLVNLNQ